MAPVLFHLPCHLAGLSRIFFDLNPSFCAVQTSIAFSIYYIQLCDSYTSFPRASLASAGVARKFPRLLLLLLLLAGGLKRLLLLVGNWLLLFWNPLLLFWNPLLLFWNLLLLLLLFWNPLLLFWKPLLLFWSPLLLLGNCWNLLFWNCCLR